MNNKMIQTGAKALLVLMIFTGSAIAKSGEGKDNGNQSWATNIDQLSLKYDYLAQAKALLGKKGREQEDIRLLNQALAIRQSAEAYFYRAYAKSALGYNQGAIADFNQAIAINPRYSSTYYNRVLAKNALGDKQGKYSDYKLAAALGDQDAKQWINFNNGDWCRNSP
jgi:tetratricopeptide (TPR) repeat protein